MTKLFSALVVLSSSAVVMAAPNATNGINGAATTSATVTSVAPVKKKVAFSYLAETTTPMVQANRGEGASAFEAQQHVGIKYDLGNDRSVQYRQYFFYNMTDDTVTNEWALGDAVIQATDATAYNIGSAPVLAYARMYFPVSEASRDIGKYELRLVNAVEHALPNKFTAEAAVAVRGYAYTGDEAGQRAARLLPGVELSHQTTKPVGLFVGMFRDMAWYHPGRADGSSYTDGVYTDVGMSAKIPGNVSLRAYAETQMNAAASATYEDATSYNLELGVTL